MMKALVQRMRSSALVVIEAQARKRWVTLLMLGMLVGCNEILGIEPGIASDNSQPECQSVFDCVKFANDCTSIVACEANKCKLNFAPAGQKVAVQNPGDCVVRVCDGQGNAGIEPDENDIPDDHNPCTKDSCASTSQRHENLDGAIKCSPGPSEVPEAGACMKGTRHCNQGQPLDTCQGAIVPVEETCTTAIDDDCDGDTNDGSDCACLPGTTISCYNGPGMTIEHQPCHAGTQTCLADGTGYGPCTGEKLPMPETCDVNGIDEDCDGLINEEGANCQCGDNKIQADLGEECDDANDVPTDGCNHCRLPVCGDGFVQNVVNEECDDGNADSTDDCTALCQVPRCGDGFVQPVNSESCDDGNTIDGDDCPSDCHAPVVAIAAGSAHTCVLFNGGRVKCWGGNSVGQLGLGDTTSRGNKPGQLGSTLLLVNLGGTVVSLAAGSMHTCALFDTGQVKCWGANKFGQLGLGNMQDRGDQAGEMDNLLPLDLGEAATAISLGSAHSCALLASGAVKCWGYGYFGQLGRGTRDNFGAAPSDSIKAAPAIDLGTGRTASAISAGQYHTCALLDDGSVKCWGFNEFGQLGLGTVDHRGDEPGEMGNALPAIALGNGVKALRLASGAGHVCVQLEDNTMKCWGANHFGQLGLGDGDNRGDQGGEIGALSSVDFGNAAQVSAISLGATHTCAQLQDGSLRCFGRGSHGQLGQGNGEWIGNMMGEVAALAPIDLGMNESILGFTAGGDHTCAVINNGRVKCWGRNDQGQLGLGDVEARGDEKDEMGSFLTAVELW